MACLAVAWLDGWWLVCCSSIAQIILFHGHKWAPGFLFVYLFFILMLIFECKKLGWLNIEAVLRSTTSVIWCISKRQINRFPIQWQDFFLSLDFWTVIIKCDVILPYFKLLLLSIPLPKYEEWVVMNGCLPITLNQSGHSTLTCGTNKAFSLFWDSVNLIDCLG